MSKNIDDLKKNYLEAEILESTNENIDNILMNLPKENSQRHSLLKNVASIILVLGISTILLFMGSDSVRASIKSLFGSLGFSSVINEKSENYSEVVGNTIDYKGYKVKINEVIFTQNGLIYTFSLDKSFKGNYEDSKILEKIALTEFYNGIPIQKVKINGNEVTPEKLTGYCKVDDTGENIIGYQIIMLDELNENDKIEIIGEFNLEFNANIKLNEEDVFVLKDKISKKNEEAAIEIENIVSTPMFTYVAYTLEINENIKDDYNLKSMIVNENSRDMNYFQSSDETIEEISPNKVRISTFLPQYKESVRELKFIPTIGIEPKKFVKGYEEYVFEDLNIELPLEIRFKDWGIVKINSIEEKENKIFVNCDVDGINKDRLLNNIWIAPKSSEEKLKDTNVILNFNPVWSDLETYNNLKNFDDINNITLGFTKELDGEEYSLGYNTSFDRINVLSDLIIEVKIK